MPHICKSGILHIFYTACFEFLPTLQDSHGKNKAENTESVFSTGRQRRPKNPTRYNERWQKHHCWWRYESSQLKLVEWRMKYGIYDRERKVQFQYVSYQLATETSSSLFCYLWEWLNTIGLVLSSVMLIPHHNQWGRFICAWG